MKTRDPLRVGSVAAATVVAVSCTIFPPPDYGCPDCAVQLDHVVTLGRGPDKALWGYPSSVWRDGGGRYLVQVELHGPAPYVFDSDGRFVGRLDLGSGYHELLPGTGDSLYLFENQSDRGTEPPALAVLTAEGEEVRRAPLGGGAEGWPGRPLLALGDGGVLAHSVGKPGDGVLVRLDAWGRTTGRFGPALPDPEDPALGLSPDQRSRYGPVLAQSLAIATTERLLAPAPGGDVWAVSPRFRPRIERWTLGGELVSSLEPDAPWFTPYAPSDQLGRRGESWAGVTGVWGAEDGALWLVGLARDEDWNPASKSAPELLNAGERFFSEMYDGVITAIDPESGEALAFQRLPEITGHMSVPAPGMIAIRRKVGEHRWTVDVVAVSELQRHPRDYD